METNTPKMTPAQKGAITRRKNRETEDAALSAYRADKKRVAKVCRAILDDENSTIYEQLFAIETLDYISGGALIPASAHVIVNLPGFARAVRELEKDARS